MRGESRVFCLSGYLRDNLIGASFGTPAPPVPRCERRPYKNYDSRLDRKIVSSRSDSQSGRSAYILEPIESFRVRGLPEPQRLREVFYGEFDPGSGLTLAACLTHASRTR